MINGKAIAEVAVVATVKTVVGVWVQVILGCLVMDGASRMRKL
jgi:hypothetical protein